MVSTIEVEYSPKFYQDSGTQTATLIENGRVSMSTKDSVPIASKLFEFVYLK